MIYNVYNTRSSDNINKQIICNRIMRCEIKCLEINYNSNIDIDNCIEIYNNYLKCKKRLEFINPKLKY